jgi:hypothetical protein
MDRGQAQEKFEYHQPSQLLTLEGDFRSCRIFTCCRRRKGGEDGGNRTHVQRFEGEKIAGRGSKGPRSKGGISKEAATRAHTIFIPAALDTRPMKVLKRKTTRSFALTAVCARVQFTW